MAITPERYLEILESATPTDHPFISLPDSEELGASFAEMGRSMARFVRACQAHEALGYDGALDNLEDVVHCFPKPQEEALVALLEGLAEAIAVDAETDAQDDVEDAETTKEDGAK